MSRIKYSITVNGQYGAHGCAIAEWMGKKLGINIYNSELTERAADRLQVAPEEVNELEEVAVSAGRAVYDGMLFQPTTRSNEEQDHIFETQRKIIQELAAAECCIIIGRCADFVLSDPENTLHIYVYADYDKRLSYCMEDLGMSEAEARRKLQQMDQDRENYHIHYAGYAADDKRFKDIMINSGLLGVEGTAAILTEVVKQRFSL